MRGQARFNRHLNFFYRFLQWCPDKMSFITLCVIIRMVNAVGASMASVSNYSILSITFPHHVAIVNVSVFNLRRSC